MPMQYKFVFVVICLAFAGMSYFFCKQKKDWAWLVAGLIFTVGADYFLVLHDRHLPGVAVFCFAHVCYIFRALENFPRWRRYAFVCLPFLAAAIFIAFITGQLFVLSGIYAGLFGINITVNVRHFKQEKTVLPRFNKTLFLAGLILFALCDVNVLLFNLPRQLGVPVIFPWAFRLIWVFYLPAQVLIALSAVKFDKS